jgi:polar amino acid transport system substrate-binding protein
MKGICYMNFGNKLFIICLIFISVPVFILAQDSSVLSRLLKSGELRVGTSATQPPYTAKAKDGKLMGYEIELAKLLAEAMNVKVKFVEKPFAHLLPALEKGEIDIVMSGLTMTAERNLKAAFAGPYIVSGRSILAKGKRLAKLDEMEEINKPTIHVVVLEGSVSQKYVENLVPNVKLVTVKDYESGVKMVLEDTVDLMVADYSICMLSLFRHPESDLATLDVPLTVEPVGIAIPPQEFLLHNLLENYLNALEITGVLDNLENKWFNDGSWLIRLP